MTSSPAASSKGAQPDRPTSAELPELDLRMQALFKLAFPNDDADPERALAESVLTLMHLEKAFASRRGRQRRSARAAGGGIKLNLKSGARALFGSKRSPATISPPFAAPARAVQTGGPTRARCSRNARVSTGWSTIHQPPPLIFDKLVQLKVADPNIAGAFEGPDEHLRRRDGFKLTDRRFDTRQVMNEVDYCVICHEREKDSCAKGFKEKDPKAAGHTYKKNPLGIPLTGCPLEEHISEMHLLKSHGDSLGALAMIVLDNPMCPGTGHRICNDCMKACIFQKQEPVNIPQIETSVLTDVLNLPYGFESSTGC